MAEELSLSGAADRKTIYDEIVPQIASLVEGETDVTANLANIAAVLKEAFGFFWVGFYLSKEDQLVLGPFQGPLACTRINFDTGVCGHAYTTRETVIVPELAHSRSAITLSSVVLPQPEGPMKDTNSPSATESPIFDRA